MPDIPYEVIDDDRGPRVIRGADLIGWTSEARDAESFARELNALQSRLAKLEAAAKAAEALCVVAESNFTNRELYVAVDAFRDALEATDG